MIENIKFDDKGLVPVVVQQYDSKEVLMLAYMNKEAIIQTIATKKACYFSRSRNKLWQKGEESGQVQDVVSLFVDCDGDTILLAVKQTGVACHTGHRSCFYRKLEGGELIEITKPIVSEKELYNKSK